MTVWQARQRCGLAGMLVAFALLVSCGQKSSGDDSTGEENSPPACPSGQVDCEGACYDLRSAPAHCGACGNTCPSDAVCAQGVCSSSCGLGTTACDRACVDTASNAAHCGACDNVCPAGHACVAGACVCPGGTETCAGSCVDTGTDPAHCGACDAACGAGQACVSGVCVCDVGSTVCGEACVDVVTDPNHCGQCGNACPAAEVCSGGLCRSGGCPSWETQCDRSCVDTAADPNHCGSCAAGCAVGEVCVGGACECPGASELCGGACVDLGTDEENCGACGARCGSAQTCSGGECVCSAELVPCGDACVDITSDAAHCGACNQACAPTEVCANGSCGAECPTNQTLCGQSCVNTQRNANHCGACNQACAPGEVCEASACACPTGQQACGGTCLDVATDPENCGACDVRCNADQSCVAGQCTCPAGEEACGGRCVDVSSSPAHCGGCGNQCGDAEVCSEGVCLATCPPSQTRCASACVNTTTSEDHCGSCNAACSAGRECVAGTCGCPQGQILCEGTCVDPQTSHGHCGGCAAACAAEQSCVAGSCTCPANQSLCGTDCVPLATDPMNCGACGAVCPSGHTCTGGACSSDVPVVAFVVPAAGATFAAGERIDVEVTATDSDGIANVRLYVGDAPVRQDGAAPYQWNSDADAALDLAPGTYTLRAEATDGVGATGEAEITIQVSPSSTGEELAVDIGISEIAIYQATKIRLMQNMAAVENRNAPIIAGRPALIRIFVAPTSGFVSREVRGKLLWNGKEYSGSEPISGPSTDAEPQSTLNFIIPAEEVTAQVALRASLHEDGAIVPGSVSPSALWPASGDFTFEATDLTDGFRITFVPLIVNGTTAKNTRAALDPFIAFMWARYPMPSIEYRIHDPVAATSSSWQGLLTQVADLRQEEDAAPNDYYYGLVPGGGSGVQGISHTVSDPNQLHPRASIGRDATSSIDTFPHEVGHAMGRRHAPCGTSGDSNYPYAGGGIGVWGYDIASSMILNPSTHADYMSYCDPEFTSDYTFRALAQRISTIRDIAANDVAYDVAPEWFDRAAIDDDHAERLPPIAQAGTPGAEDIAVTVLLTDGTTLDTRGRFFAVADVPGGSVYLPSGTLDAAVMLRVAGGAFLPLDW